MLLKVTWIARDEARLQPEVCWPLKLGLFLVSLILNDYEMGDVFLSVLYLFSGP